MSASNGVIRIGRKGIKKFAFGEEGKPFEVDVIVAFQQWIAIDEEFRGEDGEGSIKTEDIPAYHQAAVEYVKGLTGPHERLAADGATVIQDEPEGITTAEALDFLARLREQYDELADFFRPRSRAKPDSPATSGAELRFSEEVSSPTSTN